MEHTKGFVSPTSFGKFEQRVPGDLGSLLGLVKVGILAKFMFQTEKHPLISRDVLKMLYTSKGQLVRTCSLPASV